MIDGIPNRPLYFYQKDIIGGIFFGGGVKYHSMLWKMLKKAFLCFFVWSVDFSQHRVQKKIKRTIFFCPKKENALVSSNMAGKSGNQMHLWTGKSTLCLMTP